VRRDVFFGDEQQMHRRLGCDVLKAEAEVVLIDMLAGNCSSDDFAEEAIGSHAKDFIR
jgi:hypothetical protein